MLKLKVEVMIKYDESTVIRKPEGQYHKGFGSRMRLLFRISIGDTRNVGVFFLENTISSGKSLEFLMNSKARPNTE